MVNTLHQIITLVLSTVPIWTPLSICADDNPAEDVVSGEEWPHWRGPRGDGSWNTPPLPDEWPASGLTVRWKHSIGGGFSGVVAADGRVITMDRATEPREQERVICRSASTGEQLWVHSDDVTYGDLDYGSGPRASPTIFDGRVYTVGAIGQVNCLDVKSGAVIWSTHLVNDFDGRIPKWGYAAPATIIDDTVIVLPGGSDNASIVALDRRTGNVKWSSLPDIAGYSPPVLMKHEGRRELVTWTPENIRSVDPTSGQLLWTVPYKVTEGVSMATPILHRGLVVVCGYWEGSKAVRLGGTSGDFKLAWEENRYLRGVMSQPLSFDGHGYLIDKKFGLTCFDISTGEKVWDADNNMTPSSRNPQAWLVRLNNSDRVIVLNSDGELILARIDPEGYTEHSRTKIIGETWAHPAFYRDVVIARSDNTIVCVELHQ